MSITRTFERQKEVARCNLTAIKLNLVNGNIFIGCDIIFSANNLGNFMECQFHLKILCFIFTSLARNKIFLPAITPNYITNQASFCLGDEFVTMVDERIRHDKEKINQPL